MVIWNGFSTPLLSKRDFGKSDENMCDNSPEDGWMFSILNRNARNKRRQVRSLAPSIRTTLNAQQGLSRGALSRGKKRGLHVWRPKNPKTRMNGETEPWIIPITQTSSMSTQFARSRGKILTKSIANGIFIPHSHFLQYSIKIGPILLDFQVKNTERSILKTNGRLGAISGIFPYIACRYAIGGGLYD